MWLFFAALIIVIVWFVIFTHRRPRHIHWRGPRDDSRAEVEAEHLKLFDDPRHREEDEDDE